MSAQKLQILLKDYMQYFQWLLEKELTTEELDYMFHLRDRLEEAQCNLGDLDNVLRMQAKQILKHKQLFEQPMGEYWWWNRAVWEKLATQRQSIQMDATQNARRLNVVAE